MVYSSNLIIPPDYWTYQVKTNKIKCYVSPDSLYSNALTTVLHNLGVLYVTRP